MPSSYPIPFVAPSYLIDKAVLTQKNVRNPTDFTSKKTNYIWYSAQ